MLGTITDLLGGWQVKLIILITVLIIAFSWHKIEVNKAVTKSVAEVELRVHREKFKLLDKANEDSIKLKEQIDKNKQEKDRELKIANSKYNNLLKWVRSIPSQTGDSDSTGNTGDSEAGREEVIAELRRRHANDLAKYSLDAEEVRIALQQCYRDYNNVRKSINEFTTNNRRSQ